MNDNPLYYNIRCTIAFIIHRVEDQVQSFHCNFKNYQIFFICKKTMISIIVHSWAKVPDITGNFTYISTRYSNFIGDFDEECSITAPMVKLNQGENLCYVESIDTNISGKVLVTFGIIRYGCHEEAAYENAIILGAIAVLDAVFMPPGSFHSVHNENERFKSGDIPFVQVGTEFFRTFAIQGSSTAFDSLNGTLINIEGCADISPIIGCYDIYQFTLMMLSFPALFGLKLAYKAIRKLMWTPACCPRVILIAYEGLVLFLTSMIFFFGLDFKQMINLLKGNVVSAQVKDVLGILQIGGTIHGSLMSAIYWYALQKGCFDKESQTSEYWRKHFFLSPWQFIALGTSNFYRGDVDDFETLLRVVIWIDIICGLILFVSMMHFILTLRKIAPNSRIQTVSSKEQRWKKNLLFVRNTIRDVIRGETLSLKRNDPNTANLSSINSKLINLSLHLAKWLTLYVILMVISSCVLLYGFFENLPFGVLQHDPDGCKAYTFFFSYVGVKIFTSHCKIVGLAGPNNATEIELQGTNRRISQQDHDENTLRLTRLSSNTLMTHESKPLTSAADIGHQCENKRREKPVEEKATSIMKKLSFNESLGANLEGRKVSKLRQISIFYKDIVENASKFQNYALSPLESISENVSIETLGEKRCSRKVSSIDKLSI
eukprot:maker-scaffold_12-snap-gene-2.3-mRNA-1 protein AED:0.25 eAED:0.33 QI:0/0.33/0.5/1/0.33/0.25/4/0/658